MKSKDEKIADLQRICSRAHYVLSEHWQDYCDPEGYGPSTLLTDLELAANGKERSEFTVMTDALRSSLRKQLAETEELTLMLDVINSSIVTGAGMPEKNSPCHKKILELMKRNGRKPTAGSGA